MKAPCVGEFLLRRLPFLGLGQDVDVPAGQLRGEAHILAAATDSEQSCSSGTTTSMRLLSSSSTTLATSAGAKRVHDEGRRVRRPLNDVDLFALQLGHNRLNAAAAHADAGADRIDRRIVETTAIFARLPGSRATDLISMTPS